MLREKPSDKRNPASQTINCDLAVVGGGLAGVCCAITAARAGIDVALLQDRPVLGGNASSEVRMIALGATASMANNNRWAREGGVIDEFLVENAYRNPEGNSLISDTILLEMVAREPRIRLLLDTAVFDAETTKNTIDFVRAFCPQNSTLYKINAPLFCDASGDGILGYLGGAAFRMGAESADEHGEPLAPSPDYGELLGHTIYFQSKDTGRPVRFVPPDFALDDITKISRWERISPAEQGCQYWWLEYGGRLDTIHDSQAIKWELWRIVYGIWNHIKNSGRFAEAENLTLEWVGTVPGKRESRRFEGDYILTQNDVVSRKNHHDAVSYGGWSMDLHPADGLYADHAACSQWHAKGVFPIPFRSMYSRNVGNLFLAGRIISVSHVAFGATRVMATCAHNAQAVGMAAAICRRENIGPAELANPQRVGVLRQALARAGQYIPGYRLEDPHDLAREAEITASSCLLLDELEADGPPQPLSRPWAVLLPAAAGRLPRFTFRLDVDAPTQIELQLRTSLDADTYTPETLHATRTFDLSPGADQPLHVDFDLSFDSDRYVFVCLVDNPHVSARCSRRLVSGVATLTNAGRADVTAGAAQDPPQGIGIDGFEFWRPLARTTDKTSPDGCNLAFVAEPPLDVFGPQSVANGIARPTATANAWVADPSDPAPTLKLAWDKPRRIARIELVFDTDRDNPLYSVLYGNAENVMPQCVRRYRILDLSRADGQPRVLYQCDDNHQTRNSVRLDPAVSTDTLAIELTAPPPSDTGVSAVAGLFEVRCYEEGDW